MLGRPVLVLAVAVLGLGCTFDKRALQGSPDAGPVDAAPDTVAPPDAPGEGGGSCTEGHRQCSGPVLQECVGGKYEQVEVCPLGCKVDETRCYKFRAANVGDGDLATGNTDLLITDSGNFTLDVETGRLDENDLPAGVVKAMEPQGGDDPDLFVVRVRDFAIGPNTRLAVVGSRALVILASGEITIEGILEVSAAGSAGGPGGFGGGGREEPGHGPYGGSAGTNGGTLSFDSAGGGGGGGGVNGGAGGKGGGQGPIGGGSGTTDRTLRPLFGGSGGGGGADVGDAGGGGGGAVQLSAARRITVSGSIRALGGGGGRGTAPALSDFGAGSGGGAGGAVLLEAPVIEFILAGTLVVGGGGGGGAAGTPDGAQLFNGAEGSGGLPSGAAAPGGGPGYQSEGGGGSGGSIGALAGDGANGSVNGGGGGGAAGRACFASQSGHATLAAGLSPAESGGLTAEAVLVKE